MVQFSFHNGFINLGSLVKTAMVYPRRVLRLSQWKYKSKVVPSVHASFLAICSSRISFTVRATMTLWLRLKNDRIDCRHVNFQGDDERFSCFVAARRQTAANLSAYFQMAALCRDAATSMSSPCTWFGMPPRAMAAQFSNSNGGFTCYFI